MQDGLGEAGTGRLGEGIIAGHGLSPQPAVCFRPFGKGQMQSRFRCTHKAFPFLDPRLRSGFAEPHYKICMSPSRSPRVDAGIKVCRGLEILVTQKPPHQLVGARIGVEGE
jgi:hypothetical protein